MQLSSLVDGFIDELEKISSSKEHKKPDWVTRSYLGAATPALANMASSAMYNGTLDTHRTPGEFKDIAHGIQTGMGLTDTPVHLFTHNQAPTAAGILEAGIEPSDVRNLQRVATIAPSTTNSKPGDWFVSAPTNTREAVLAHEFGHVKNHTRLGGAFTKAVNAGRKLMLAGQKNIGVPVVPMFAAARSANSEEPTWTPGLVNAAISAPVLADEGLASARAAKYMTGRYGIAKGLKSSLPLLPAFGTYAALGLSPLAITAGRKLYRKHKANQQEKQASAASMGALLGGSAGYGLTKGIKGTLAGAALGGLAGKALSVGNQVFVKGPEEQKQMLAQMPSRATQDYVPSWMQQSQNMYPY